MSRDGQESYEELPYEDLAYYHTHPSNLAVVATQCGVTPPKLSNCRVLELGCGTGFNLLAMAQSLPEATFVGLDLSKRQIAMGRATADAINCSNVELRVADVTQCADSLGEFDYIIAHGLFSWVSREVRSAIPNICKRHLAPTGIAYISYNTFPGWHQRTLLRDILRFHAPADASPLEKVRIARAALARLVLELPALDSDYARFLKSEVASLRDDPDACVFHEFLESHNHPILFEEFVTLARSSGFQYLGEARYGTNSFSQDTDTQERLAAVSDDLIRREQQHDFLRNRFFRQSLLCHATARPTWLPSLDCLRSLWILGEKAVRESDDPAMHVIEQSLSRFWPKPIVMEEFIATLRDQSGCADDDSLITATMRGYADGHWQLFAFDPPFVNTASDKPRACPLARRQAANTPEVTNRLHRPVCLSELEQAILQSLDGQSTRDELASKLPCGRKHLDSGVQSLANAALLIE